MLTPEREKEILSWLRLEGNITGQMAYELLGELDRVRAESCADLIGQEHRLGTRIEILEIELDRVRAEKNLVKSIDPETGEIELYSDALEVSPRNLEEIG